MRTRFVFVRRRDCARRSPQRHRPRRHSPGAREIPGARERARVPIQGWPGEHESRSVGRGRQVVQRGNRHRSDVRNGVLHARTHTHGAEEVHGSRAAYEKCRDLYLQQSGRQYTNAQERQRNRDTRLREIDEVIRSYQSAQPDAPGGQDAIRQLQNQRRRSKRPCHAAIPR